MNCPMNIKYNLFFIPLLFIAETNDTTNMPGMDLVINFFVAILPALFMLAILSILFGFIRAMSGRIEPARYIRYIPYALILLILFTALPIHTASNLTLYYFDIDSSGLYYIDNLYVYDVFDAYGNKIQVYRLEQSDWFPTGYIFEVDPGRYYLYAGEPGSFPVYSTDLTITYSYDPTNLTLIDETKNELHSLVYADQNYINLTRYYDLKAYSSYNYTLFDTYVYIINDTVLNITIKSVSMPDIVTLNVKIIIDDTATVYDFPSPPNNETYSIQISKGFHSITVVVYPYQDSTGEAYFYFYFICKYIVSGTIVFPTRIVPQEASNVEVSSSTETYKVYAHNFTIISNESQQLKYFIIPVYTNEVEQLTNLNPVILEHETNVVRPALLVDLHNRKFIVFQSWSNATIANYTIIWNYPQSTTIIHVFFDNFRSDPLLVWSETVKENVSTVTYDASHYTLNITGSSLRYMISRSINFNASAVLAYVESYAAMVWSGSGNLSLVTYPLSSNYIMFAKGSEYIVSISESSTVISMQMDSLAHVFTYSPGQNIAVAVEDPDNAVIGGVIAVPETIEYNVSLNKQLLRLTISIERYQVGYSTPSAVGYWTHMVQCTIYYDPAYLPPVEYFNVRLELPEHDWVAQGLARPGLVDIAITDAQSELLDFYIEPYLLPDGDRVVWLKLPADPSRNFYVVNILLNNTMLTTSLSTYNAFIQYYYAQYGLGNSWDQDSDGYIVTQNLYVNTIAVIPESSSFSFKLAYTPYDYYIITPASITEVHGSYSEQIHSFEGFFVQNQVQWIYYDRSGRLQYYQGSSMIWEVTDLDKPWSWPPTIVGAKDSSLIGLAILVPYSYSIGTITGGKWSAVEAEPVSTGGAESPIFDWAAMGQMILALMPLIIIAIVFRLIQNPPSITRSSKGGII